MDRLLHVGIEVHGIDEGRVLELASDVPESEAELLQGRAEALAPVPGDQDDSLAGESSRGEAGNLGDAAANPAARQQQGVDDGVARDEDARVRNPLGSEILRRLSRSARSTSD